MILDFISAIRVKDYVKNIFIFLPLFFGHRITELYTNSALWFGFISFCMVSSAVYLLNDLKDRHLDSLHPVKKERPIASGAISPSTAKFLCLVMLCGGLILAYVINRQVALILSIYFFQNVLYTYFLKHYAIIDVQTIALGFIWRIVVGGLLVAIPISPWLFLMTYLLANAFAFGKRYDDLIIQSQTSGGVSLRKVNTYYTVDFLRQIISLVLTVTIVCYIMYTLSTEVTNRIQSPWFFITVIPIIIGVLRYLALLIIENKSGSPTRLFFSDRILQVIGLCWTLLIIYFNYLT